ncbi:MAG: hypothetical protein HN952_05095, partial [Candidatus Cloacimonetes bacterium]|nr:hypothetical protein [Candidatus Cloacimonadota bacterium]
MKFLKLLIINLLLLTVFACSETQPFNNPYDPAVDPDDWAPTELTYTVIDVNSIKLDWVVNCNIEAGFIIERKVNTGSWTILADLASNTTTYTDNNAEINQILQYRVYGFAGEQESSSVTTNAIDNAIPAPSDLQISQIDVHTFTLNWLDNSIGEAGFIIERKINNGSWQQLADLNSNTTTYTDNTVNNENDFSYRVYAYVTEYVSAYSNEIIFVGAVTDIDGNIYEIVQIGNQIWMAENLKVTHYRNGDAIPTGLSNSSWSSTTSGAYAVYNDNESYADTYGYLYNWYAVD